jgi:hypothetical protein
MSISMSYSTANFFVDEFHDDLYHVCQQKESRLAGTVRTEYGLIAAEDKAFDMMDEFELQEKTGRSPETPTLDPSTQRRWVTTTPYHQSVRYDKDDDLSIKLDLTGDFVTAFVRGVNRKKDDIIIAAFEAATTSGRRAGSTITWASQDGNTKYTALNTGRTIAHDTSTGNASASDTGMTTEKIELALEYFSNNEVDDSIPIWCVISPRQATNLFGQEEYVNVDYNDAKPLTVGRLLGNWMGVNWVSTPKIVLGSSNDVDSDTAVYECWCWAQDGMILGVADELTIEIDRLPTYSYAQQVYVHMNMGCMRFDEDKVIKIECQA